MIAMPSQQQDDPTGLVWVGFAASVRLRYARRPRHRAPAGSARWRRRPAPAGRAPAATAGRAACRRTLYLQDSSLAVWRLDRIIGFVSPKCDIRGCAFNESL